MRLAIEFGRYEEVDLIGWSSRCGVYCGTMYKITSFANCGGTEKQLGKPILDSIIVKLGKG
jgi:hypothetical protein